MWSLERSKTYSNNESLLTCFFHKAIATLHAIFTDLKQFYSPRGKDIAHTDVLIINHFQQLYWLELMCLYCLFAAKATQREARSVSLPWGSKAPVQKTKHRQSPQLLFNSRKCLQGGYWDYPSVTGPSVDIQCIWKVFKPIHFFLCCSLILKWIQVFSFSSILHTISHNNKKVKKLWEILEKVLKI